MDVRSYNILINKGFIENPDFSKLKDIAFDSDEGIEVNIDLFDSDKGILFSRANYKNVIVVFIQDKDRLYIMNRFNNSMVCNLTLSDMRNPIYKDLNDSVEYLFSICNVDYEIVFNINLEN